MQSCFENVFIESIALLICFPNPHSVKYVDVGGLLSDRLRRAKQTKKQPLKSTKWPLFKE